jgi:hypothetical protein
MAAVAADATVTIDASATALSDTKTSTTTTVDNQDPAAVQLRNAPSPKTDILVDILIQCQDLVNTLRQPDAATTLSQSKQTDLYATLHDLATELQLESAKLRMSVPVQYKVLPDPKTRIRRAYADDLIRLHYKTEMYGYRSCEGYRILQESLTLEQIKFYQKRQLWFNCRTGVLLEPGQPRDSDTISGYIDEHGNMYLEKGGYC